MANWRQRAKQARTALVNPAPSPGAAATLEAAIKKYLSEQVAAMEAEPVTCWTVDLEPREEERGRGAAET